MMIHQHSAHLMRSSSGRGFVLPVVLVMLVLMTVVVLFMTRRSAIDERLAFNVRGVVTLETAAQYALRWCELALWVAPPGIATATSFGDTKDLSVPAKDAPPSSSDALWRGDWGALPTLALPTDALAAAVNVGTASCLIEDAREELQMSAFSSGQPTLVLPETRRKFRLTSRVVGAVGSDGDGVAVMAHAQSEVRMNLN